MPSGITKLPPFQIAASNSPAKADPSAAMPHLDARDVHLMTLYGRVYCAYLDVQAGKLLLYRFYSYASYPAHNGCCEICLVNEERLGFVEFIILFRNLS